MRIDASDLRSLSRDLGQLGAKSTAAMFDVYREGARDLRDTWRHNAEETSGKAARFYPASITDDVAVGRHIETEVGPDRRLKQGKLGPVLEYGSPTSPAHLDGQRAADVVGPRLHRRIDVTLGVLLNEAGL